MGRVLIIAIAAVIGAAGVWFLAPTAEFENVPVNKDMPVFTYDPDRPERPDAVDSPNGMMSSEDRRERAEQLIGKPLKYITPDVVRDEAWYAGQGKDVIKRSMDECYLLLEYHQYAHQDAPTGEATLGEGGWADAALEIPMPTRQQNANCISVYKAYFAMHGMKFEF